jgi:hypothetical protein
MKIKLSFEDFIKLSKADYKEDLYDSVYCDYQKFSIDDIIYNADRASIQGINEDTLKDSDLFEACNSALNSLEEKGYIDALYKRQLEGIENIASKLADFHGIDITFDLKSWQFVITGKVCKLACQIVEVIDGEGYFDGKACLQGYKNKTEFVKAHLHYLLDYSLINAIYGVWNRRELEYDYDNVFRTCPSKEEIKAEFEFRLGEIGYKEQLKLNLEGKI